MTLLLPSGLSLSPPASQSFLNASFYLVHSSFWSLNSILFPHQAGFRLGPSTLDQILFLSQSILDGFNKPRAGSSTILANIDFSKAFGCLAPHPFSQTHFGWPPSLFARWTQSFLSDRRDCVVYQKYKSCSFRVRQVFRKDPFFRHFQRALNRERRGQVRINVAAY